MNKQLYWEDIQVDYELPPIAKVATSQILVKWAGASGDYNPLHYEDTFAAAQGMGKPIIHGALKRQWLIHLVTSWMGEQGTLKKFSCQYKAVDYPRLMKSMAEPEEGETWWCRGKVTKKYIENDEHCLDCQVRVENGKGEATTQGKATVILPAKG